MEYKTPRTRKSIAKYIFDQRQNKYRQNAPMNEQVRIFFRDKFDEVFLGFDTVGVFRA